MRTVLTHMITRRIENCFVSCVLQATLEDVRRFVRERGVNVFTRLRQRIVFCKGEAFWDTLPVRRLMMDFSGYLDHLSVHAAG